MNAALLLSPPVAFVLCLLLAGGVYLFGRLIGEPAQPSAGKQEPYACGEEFRAEKFEIGYRRFFVAALFFTMMHVAVLCIATVPGGALSLRALGYLVVIAASVSILYREFD